MKTNSGLVKAAAADSKSPQVCPGSKICLFTLSIADTLPREGAGELLHNSLLCNIVSLYGLVLAFCDQLALALYGQEASAVGSSKRWVGSGLGFQCLVH